MKNKTTTQKKGVALHHNIAMGVKPKNFKGAVANAVANKKKK